MVAYADLALYDRSGRLAAVAEVKSRFGTSREWAAQTRRNILAHGAPSDADFFLLVTPDRLYLWKDAGTDPIGVPPTFEADTQPEFAPQPLQYQASGISRFLRATKSLSASSIPGSMGGAS